MSVIINGNGTITNDAGAGIDFGSENISTTGVVSGVGSGLTALPAANLTGTVPAGSLSGATYPTNVPNVAPGSNGNVLTSNGSAWTSAAAAGGGSLTLIGTQDSGGSDATLVQTGLTGFDTFMVVISDLCPQTHSSEPEIRVGDSSGIDSGVNDYAFYNYGGIENGTATSGSDNLHSGITTAHSNGVGEYANLVFYVHSAPSGTMRTGVHGQCQYLENDGLVAVSSFGGFRQAAITLDRVSIQFSSGNITSGSMTVYGLGQS